MKQVYPTFIAKGGDDFLVYVPDMDIYTEGKNIADAIEMARDAIGLKGVAFEDSAMDLPVPSDEEEAIRKAKADTEFIDYSEGILTYVDIDFTYYRNRMEKKSVRRNVTLPKWLDLEADKAGINVSQVLRDALIAELNLSKQ